jgi:hypothetical protein
MRELLGRSLREDVDVTFDFPDDLWAVEVDPGELELVVLISPSMLATRCPWGGTILLRGENRCCSISTRP